MDGGQTAMKTPTPHPSSGTAVSPARSGSQLPHSDPHAASSDLDASSLLPPRPPLQRNEASVDVRYGAFPSTTPTPTPVTDPHTTSLQSSSTEDCASEFDPIRSRDATAESDTVERIVSAGEEERAIAGAKHLERLREEVQASITFNSQRVKMKPQTGPLSRTPSGLSARRISPIKEESSPVTLSPSLEAAFSAVSPSPMETRSISTESTESVVTVRGNVPVTPGQTPIVRNPAYPFPRVPPSPFGRPSFQPFTALSPTVTSRPQPTLREYQISEGSTPLGSTATFVPGEQDGGGSDSSFPSPNLYDLVLQLNSEPGLEAFWSTLTTILRDSYGAQRATLAVPADAGELENVPWGQKAAYNKAGLPNIQHTQPGGPPQQTKRQSDSATATSYEEPLLRRPTLTSERPKLASRHSYAGYERGKRIGNLGDIARVSFTDQMPSPGLTRHVSHTSSFSAAQTDVSSSQQSRHESVSFSDMDFSTTGDGPAPDQHARVFPILRALDHETEPLIDSSGVNRVLERSKLITLTRDYSLHSDDPASKGPRAQASDGAVIGDASSRAPGEQHQPPLKSATVDAKRGGRPTPDYFGIPKPSGAYEEYEQPPASPWSQSPAPSPAIQAETEESPFFNTGKVDEDSFNPVASPQDYSKYGPIEAIGVDKASTVIHVPLIHPLISQLMPFTSRGHDEHGKRKGGVPLKDAKSKSPTDQLVFRKAPIAILSILSPTVPYPRSITKSLRLLAPHLATAFHSSQQFTNARLQAVRTTHRRYGSGSRLGLSGVTAEPETLDDILNIDIDTSAMSVAGSLTSPSEYSIRSRLSPEGSISGTPGRDSGLGVSGPTGRHSVHGTPAPMLGGETAEGYFDSKARSDTGSPQSTAPATPAGKTDDRRASSQRSSTSQHGRQNSDPAKSSEPGEKDRVASGSTQSVKPPASKHGHLQAGDRRVHSILHSCGADFSATLQSVPATAVHPHTPVSTISRSSSMAEALPMPPPSEKLLRIIVDSLPVQIFIAAPITGALTWANSKFHVYRGQDSRQILEEPWQAVHPEDCEDYMKQWHYSLATGQQFSHKVRLRRFDGQYRWFFVRATPLKDRRQNIVHWAATYMDIHEQHVAEVNASRQLETAASEAKYRALANSSPQIVFVVTRSKGVTFCNSQWVLYSGQTESQALGLGFMDFVHPEDIAKCKLPTFEIDGSIASENVPTTVPTELRRTASDSTTSSEEASDEARTVTSPGTTSPSGLPQAQLSKLADVGILKVTHDADGRPSYSTEVRLKSKDGTYRWHLVRVQLAEKVIQEDEDELWYGTCTDINDHKLLEQTLKETMDAKSRFLSNTSHEIRTPLNGIIGMVNLLITSTLSAEQMENVEILRRSTESLRNLINDILDLSKVEAGMITLSMDWFRVCDLIEEVNDLTAALAINKGLELNYLVEDDVPLMLKGDPFRIRQVLLNVVGNAIKFTNEGEIFVHCQLCKDAAKGKKPSQIMVQFEVIDTGAGFTEKEAEYLFKRFSQIEKGSTRQHGGTGLGLAISMQLVELHGGKMTAKSIPGKGSTFTFTARFGLPSDADHPHDWPPESDISAPAMPRAVDAGKAEMPTIKTISESPLLYTSSPGSMQSSGSSAISISRTARTSIQSERSSASSYISEPSGKLPIDLSLPGEGRDTSSDRSDASAETVRSAAPTTNPAASVSIPPPPIYSILVVCPLPHARSAIVRHVESCLPKPSAQHICAKEGMADCKELLSGDDAVRFTHVVLNLKDVDEIVAFMDVVLGAEAYATTSLLVVSELNQKKAITAARPDLDYERIQAERKLYFLVKPVKPSKVAEIFDPGKERETSKDRNRDSAQATAITQKQIFEDLSRRFGNKGYRVLLVEDNPTNQAVLMKFMKKANIDLDLAQDGVQCVDALFSRGPDYYSIILCDLYMPNKDGFQTCKEIRSWERKNHYRRMPIVALSADVMGDVYNQCVDARFNSYVTKPIDFQEMSNILAGYFDPPDPTKPFPFMMPARSPTFPCNPDLSPHGLPSTSSVHD